MSDDRQPDGQPATTPADATDDVEGHALPIVTGVSALGRPKTPARKPADEPLPQLTRKFPSLREDTKRG
jgi:hypothetical protein